MVVPDDTDEEEGQSWDTDGSQPVDVVTGWGAGAVEGNDGEELLAAHCAQGHQAIEDHHIFALEEQGEEAEVFGDKGGHLVLGLGTERCLLQRGVVLALVPAPRGTMMQGEVALGLLTCKGPFWEHTTFTAVPSSWCPKPLELAANIRDASKWVEEGFNLSKKEKLRLFSFPLNSPKIFLQQRLARGQLFLPLLFARLLSLLWL